MSLSASSEEKVTLPLAAPGDAGKLAAALRRLLGDKVLAARITRSASEVVSKYSWEQRAETLEDLFQSVVNPG